MKYWLITKDKVTNLPCKIQVDDEVDELLLSHKEKQRITGIHSKFESSNNVYRKVLNGGNTIFYAVYKSSGSYSGHLTTVSEYSLDAIGEAVYNTGFRAFDYISTEARRLAESIPEKK